MVTIRIARSNSDPCGNHRKQSNGTSPFCLSHAHFRTWQMRVHRGQPSIERRRPTERRRRHSKAKAAAAAITIRHFRKVVFDDDQQTRKCTTTESGFESDNELINNNNNNNKRRFTLCERHGKNKNSARVVLLTSQPPSVEAMVSRCFPSHIGRGTDAGLFGGRRRDSDFLLGSVAYFLQSDATDNIAMMKQQINQLRLRSSSSFWAPPTFHVFQCLGK